MKHWPPWDEPGISPLTQVMRYQRLTSESLARGCGVPRSTVSRVMTGVLPSLDNGIRIARFLKVRVEDLWGCEVK